MTFTTPTFLVFLVVVFLLYWRLGRTAQNLLLLAASLLFYGWWDWRFLFLLLFTAGVDYAAALALGKTTAPSGRRALLVASLVANLGALATFKYFDFFSESLKSLLLAVGWHVEPLTLHVVLPVGISFYTFQALSYTVDVYRRRLDPVRDPVQYLCFITFFPQLVAGPIERASRLLPQFQRDRRFALDDATDGLRRMLWGFFKKMVVADGLAPFVNAVYSDLPTASGWQIAWATVGFAFQIYGDFSGYTDIAIGCAKLFGFELMRNFDTPYFSRSIPEFWQRWHVSLSTWFRDYVYVPLGGNRVTRRRWAANVMIVFCLSGLWHGASWTFVVWGLLHGLFYLGSVVLGRGRGEEPEQRSDLVPGLRQIGQMAVTFGLVCLTWVFFRAPSLDGALLALQRIATAAVFGLPEPPAETAPFLWAALLCAVEWVQRSRPHALHVPELRAPVRWATYYAVMATILLFASVDYRPFIYFQF